MKLKLMLLCALIGLTNFATPLFSRENPHLPKKKQHPANTQINFRQACTTAQAQIDMDINNVRARLLTGGDMWWDRSNGKYVVPKPLPGLPEVSAISTAGIWLGGYDAGGNLKVACQTYGNSFGQSDFWSGPLDPTEGITDAQSCNNWDRHFEVKGADIIEHLNLFNLTENSGPAYTEDEIPESVKGWPAKGNPCFSKVHGFVLPNTDQGLAPFNDRDGDGNYEPLEGDFPNVDLRICGELSQFPDQMVFWIYNDEGGSAVHGETNGIPIRMEIQATAFAFSTEDPINDFTYQQHKFINRATEDIDSTYFGLWVDANLGCPLDDYVGCDPSRGLAYFYNADDVDGDAVGLCQGTSTYGNFVPAIGIDIIYGPRGDFGQFLPMSSFNYFIGGGSPPPGMSSPSIDVEFYRYLSGSWRDGTLLSYGSDGYDPASSDLTKFAFPSSPNDQNGWSMCHLGSNPTSGLPSNDLQTVQSYGSFILQPGAKDELLIGVVFAPNLDYPCPDLTRLFAADDIATAFINNCFGDTQESVPGPDAPDVDWIAGDREITLLLSNSAISNNFEEGFEELVPGRLDETTDPTYDFEGYLVYQLAGPNFSYSDLGDTTKLRLVFQCDIENDYSILTNWKSEKNPGYQLSLGSEQFLYSPQTQIFGKNDGIQRTFTIHEDMFAKGSDRRLTNHCTYYYLAVAYAANDYLNFNTTTGVGQSSTFIVGRSNIGPKGDWFPYSIMPRPAQNGLLNMVQIVPNPYYHFAAYPDIDGDGFLKITNLPAQCEVDIYSLNGHLVRHFNRNEQPAPPNGSGVEELQIYPDLDWDLKNNAGKTIAAGIYLVHIRAEVVGELTLKAVII